MDSRKNTLGHVTLNLCFYIRWDMRVLYCIAVHPVRELSTRYFSCSGGTDTDPIKNASGHLTPNLCFCIRWYLWVT
jgi:hypothetical protein